MTEKQPPCDLHEFKLTEHKERLDKIDVILDKVRNRLPVWATLGIGGLLAFIGYLIKGLGT